MAILRPYKVNSYRRICDVCGRPRQIEDIRFADNVAICSIHPEYRTALQLNRINSLVRPPRILPVPQPKPLAPVDTYTTEEAQLFNLVAPTAPFDVVDVTVGSGTVTGSKSAQATAWTIIYCTDLLVENKRPAAWLTLARKVAIALGDTIIAQQAVSLARAAYLAGAVEENFGLPGSKNFTADTTALTCAALVRLFSLTDDPRYLAGATAAAGFITYLQDTAVNLIYPGGLVDYGPPVAGWDDGELTFASGYYPSSLLSVWALTLLKGIAGDITIGFASALPGATSGPTSRLLSTAISQIRSFWANGYGGINGFSAATPFEVFDNSEALWAGTTFTASFWAEALFALVEVEGITDQVTSIWNYLQGFAGINYNPKLAPAISLNGATHQVASTFYDWGAAGLLAKIQSTLDRASLKAAKDAIAVPRARFNESTPRSGDYLYLGPLGRSTFAFEPYTATNARQRSVTRACQVSMFYREQPQGFTGRDH